jgi:tRNA threonylcarbamoyladenosine biosynthesis protein TsaE
MAADGPVSRLLELADEAATGRLAASLADALRPGDLLTLAGDLGAGKTALARALIRHRTGNPAEEVPSPTFTLVQLYDTDAGPLWHFDLYRLGGADEVLELDWEEARVEGLVLTEWPDRLGALLPPDHLALTLSHAPTAGPEARRALLVGHGRWAPRLAALDLGDPP